MEAIKEFYENNKNISLKIKDIYGDFNLIGYNLLNNTLIGILKVPKNRIYYKYSNFNKLEEKYKLFNLLHFCPIQKVFLNLNLGSINFSSDESISNFIDRLDIFDDKENDIYLREIKIEDLKNN